MTALQGINAIGTYPQLGTMAARVAILNNLIPNPDAPHGTGAVSGGGFLDEMSPGAAVQIRAELAAMAAAALTASGQYTAVAADDTANLIDIVTGLADLTLTNCAITIRRAGSEVLTARTISEPTPGTIRIADATYNVTAGDVITWFAR